MPQANIVQLQDYRQQAAPPPEPEVELCPLETRKKWFQESQDLSERGRKASEQDRDYRDHKQWTAYELNTLRKRGQPPIVINRIARKVDTIIGLSERSASDPKGYPRTPKDEESAEVCTDTLRFVCDQNRYQRTKSMMLENIIVEGTGGAEVIVEDHNGEPDVIINRLRWEEIFADPYARECDFSDARYKGIAKWMHIDDIGALWGEKAQEMAKNSLAGGSMVSGSFEDRPKSMSAMTDLKGRRVVVVDMYCQYGGAWHRYVFCVGGDLVPGGLSPYLDEDGKPTCIVELASLYVNRENERYGLVRGMLGPQDEINYRRSKLLHLTSTRQTFANKIAGLDIDKVKREMSRPDGHIEILAGEFNKDFGVIPTNDMAAGQAELLQEAKQEIEMYGPNNSLQGRGSDQQSGKAWQAQQQAGLAEIATLFSAAQDLDLRIYRQIWCRVKQFWTAPRFVRVTDDENSYKFLQVNEPVLDEFMQPMIDPMTGEPQVKNRPSEMDIDIIIDASPDYINSQQEQAEMLTTLHKQGMDIPFEVILMASSLRNKKQLLDLMKTKSQADPVVEQAKQAEVAQLAADVDKTVSETEENKAQTAQIIANIHGAAIDNASKIDSGAFEHVDRLHSRQDTEADRANAREDARSKQEIERSKIGAKNGR